MLQRLCYVLFLLRASQCKDRVGPESFQPLARHALEQCSRPLAVVQIGVKEPHARSPDRARLENRPRSRRIATNASSCGCATANGALFTLATRWPLRAKLKLGLVAITTLAVQLIWRNNSSSTRMQQSSVANKLARPPADEANFQRAASHPGGCGSNSFVFRNLAVL
jgi:hypothetical protein